MSIATEIQRIESAKSSIRTAIANKGVTVPAAALLDAYPGYIAQISGGGTTDDPYKYFSEDVKLVATSGQVTAAEGYMTSPFFPMKNSCRSFTMKCASEADNNCEIICFSSTQAKVDYWLANASPRTVTHSKTTIYYCRITIKASEKDDCYIYDNTNQEYVWKGLNVV